MKKIIIVIVVVVLAIIAYNYIISGNSSKLTPEEQELERLRDDLSEARRNFREANSAGALGGADITEDIDETYKAVNRIESRLRNLKRRLKSESARQKAEQLQWDLDDFKSSL